MHLERTALEIIERAPDSSPGSPDDWAPFLGLLAVELGGAAAALLLGRDEPAEPTIMAAGIEPDFLNGWAEHYGGVDPWLPGLRGLPAGSVHFGESLVPRRELVRTEFYNGWMRPQRLRPAPTLRGTLSSRQADEGACTVGVFCRERGRLSDRSLALLRLLAPHLRRAVAAHRRCASLARERDVAMAALDHLRLGVVILDREARVRALNRSAQALLRERDGLALEGETLRAARPEASARLRHLIASAAGTDERREPEPGAVTLPRPSRRRPLTALVRPAPAPGGGSAGARQDATILFVSDPEQPLETDVGTLQRLYGFTAAEASVASRIARGERVDEIAARQGVSESTVRTQVRQVLEKTGLSRQVELVHLLLASPARLRIDS